MLKRPFYLMLTVLWCIPAMGWGPAGHQVVARVAVAHLSNNARRGVADLLDTGSTFAVRLSAAMSQVSTEADDLRNDRPQTKRWHFVNIPLGADDYDAERDCAQTPEGDCVIQALERERAALASRSNSKDRRRDALMFVVHLVGDLHQPLHCADNNDRGGTDVKVFFHGGEWKLHSVWDSGIIQASGLTATEYAESLLDDLGAPVGTMQAGEPVKWALETHALARTNVYKIPSNRQLTRSYVDKNAAVVRRQLMEAGLRLAKVLNEALSSTQ